ncbi:hypothetical protein Tco_0800207 [Tanacetum coccineum]|uniref:Uncharacterized protein n=1 Tax=Tanacetum coccineum TaxID=301880 RepID=A0ABQ4ZSF8_9ASTR
MAEQQTIKYAPEWNNMTVDNVDFLREFWSTDVAFDPFPSIDEPEKRPLKKFLIKFLVLNGQKPLTLDFNTFCSSTVLDYINGKYVNKERIGKYYHQPEFSAETTPPLNKSTLSISFLPTVSSLDRGSEYTQDKKFRFLPPILSNSNFTKDLSKVTNIELTTHMIVVNNRRDSVSPPPLTAKPKKGKSRTVTSTLPKSQGHEASGALSKKSKRPKSKKPPTETKIDIQLASTGLPSTLDEGTRKSTPFPESNATHPKDSGGNKQPLDRDLTSMTSDEGMAKTMPRPEGSLGNKDSGGNIPPADMEPIDIFIVDPPGTAAKYQVDQTPSTRLRQRPLTKNKGKTSSEVKPDTEPLQLQTFANIQAYPLSDDELDKESDEEEVLAAGDDMDEDIQAAEEVRTPSPKQDQPEPSHVQESAFDSSSPDLKRFDSILPLTERQLIKYLRKFSLVLFNRIAEKQWEHHEEAAISYADLKASIYQYYDENIAHQD